MSAGVNRVVTGGITIPLRSPALVASNSGTRHTMLGGAAKPSALCHQVGNQAVLDLQRRRERFQAGQRGKRSPKGVL